MESDKIHNLQHFLKFVIFLAQKLFLDPKSQNFHKLEVKNGSENRSKDRVTNYSVKFNNFRSLLAEKGHTLMLENFVRPFTFT